MASHCSTLGDNVRTRPAVHYIAQYYHKPLLDSQDYTLELPYPATELVIAQYFRCHPSQHTWAWLVVGTFYDSEHRELWHIELFLGCSDDSDSDSAESLLSDIVEPSNTSTIADSTSDTSDTPDISENNNDNNNINYNIVDQYPRDIALQGLPQGLPGIHFGSYFQPQFVYPSVLPIYYPTMSRQFGPGSNPFWGMDRGGIAGQAVNNGQPTGVPAGFGGTPYIVNYPGVLPAGAIPGPNHQGPVYVVPQNGYNHPVPVFPGQENRLPNPHPVVNPDAPALNLMNSTGGVGCEPGYNYFFPPEHTKLHIIKSSTAPWRLPEGCSMHFGAYHVPVNTTLRELMVGFGAQNPMPKKNRVTEVIQGGNGKWYRSVTFTGADSAQVNKKLQELGWDHTRTGRPGENPVVWLWITKD
ncbi:hypothetical protein M426DRAFT_24035 [Hypoxylon sp. CI-4A]|nr:hypothetical protein M426DRAFT_24035 [Hypoxylon sp. CI-4A]